MSAADVYDPTRDGFDNARLLMVVSRIASLAARKNAELAYGAWNPLFCSANAADEAADFFRDLTELIAHYAAQAAQGIEAGTAEAGTGSVHESPVAESDAPKVQPNDLTRD